jgi:hypothetical protein
MNFIDWLSFSITISRRLTNAYYIIMLIITLIAIFLAYKMKFKRFSLNLWLISGLICLAWEIYLFATGTRSYNFAPALELPYHALTEAGPGLIIMLLVGHKIQLFDISEYSDDYTLTAPATKFKTQSHSKDQNMTAMDGSRKKAETSDNEPEEDDEIKE